MPLRLAQISDFHFTHLTWNPRYLFSKRLLGNINWVFSRKTAFSTLHLQALPPLLASLHLDHILLGGDFTTTSLEKEFALAKTFVEQLPTPWIAIPGNHDCYTFSAHRKKLFYQYFTNHKKGASFTLKEHGVELHRLDSRWVLIALDTARATHFYTSQGLFSQKQEASLKELLATLSPETHILLLNHYPFFENDSPQRSLVRAKALETILREDRRIKAYLHGHTHRHTIANLQPSNLPVILDGGCSAQMEKGSWNLLDLDEKGLTINVYKFSNGWYVAKQEKIAWTR